MAFELKRKIYEGLPGWLKAPVGWVPFSVLAGSAYVKTMKRQKLLDRADRETLRNYQRESLSRILQFAVEQVPAYEPHRSEVERLDPFEALKSFPLISKGEIQKNTSRYLPRNFAEIPHYEGSTGGTSGNQLTFFLDDHSHACETAFMHRQWARVGYTTRRRKATFRGTDFPKADQGEFYRLNPIYNEMQLSPFHMSEERMPKYLEQLIRYNPDYLHGYPSALSLLCGFLEKNPKVVDQLSIKAALLGSEALFPDQRETIEGVLRTRAFSWYGHSERIVLGGECERTNAYHQFPDYGLLEILDADGHEVEEGETGEIVGTGFLNRSQPLIRYRTEDFARKLPWSCDCGRAFDRFDQVQGRWKQEFVIGRSGAKMSVAALNMHGSIFDEVLRYQYVQKEAGKLEFRLMVTARFGEKDQKALLDAYRTKVGDELEIEFAICDDIPLTDRGKLRRLIQEIPGE